MSQAVRALGVHATEDGKEAGRGRGEPREGGDGDWVVLANEGDADPSSMLLRGGLPGDVGRGGEGREGGVRAASFPPISPNRSWGGGGGGLDLGRLERLEILSPVNEVAWGDKPSEREGKGGGGGRRQRERAWDSTPAPPRPRAPAPGGGGGW